MINQQVECSPGGVLTIMAYKGRLRLEGYLFLASVYERVGILLVEVYERVGKSIIWVCEMASRAHK